MCCVPVRGSGKRQAVPDDLLVSHPSSACAVVFRTCQLLAHTVLSCCTAHGRRTSRDRIAPCRTLCRQPQDSWQTALQPKSRSSSVRSRPPRTAPTITSFGRRTRSSSPAHQQMAPPQPPSPCVCQHQGPGLLRSVQALLMLQRLQPQAAARSRPRLPRGTAAVQQPPRREDSSTRRQRRPCASSSAAPGRCRWRNTLSSAARRSTRRTASASSARCVMVCVLRLMQAVHFAFTEARDRRQMIVASTLFWRLARVLHLIHGAQRS